MTLENLLYNIGRTAIRNKVINYSAAGSSIFELNAETIVDYPMLFISPTGNHEVRINTTDYEITLYYLDRLLRDSANDIQIVRDFKMISGWKRYLQCVYLTPTFVILNQRNQLTEHF